MFSKVTPLPHAKPWGRRKSLVGSFPPRPSSSCALAGAGAQPRLSSEGARHGRAASPRSGGASRSAHEWPTRAQSSSGSPPRPRRRPCARCCTISRAAKLLSLDGIERFALLVSQSQGYSRRQRTRRTQGITACHPHTLAPRRPNRCENALAQSNLQTTPMRQTGRHPRATHARRAPASSTTPTRVAPTMGASRACYAGGYHSQRH